MNLEEEYEKIATRAINAKIITREEWETKFKFWRDEWGHSFIHILESIFHGIKAFITQNPIIIKNRRYIEERFGVRCMTLKEFMIENSEEYYDKNI